MACGLFLAVTACGRPSTADEPPVWSAAATQTPTVPSPSPAITPPAAPTPTRTSAAATSPPARPTPRPSASPRRTGTRYVFPVRGNASYARTHHDYPAADIMASCGARVVSPVAGVVLEVSRVDTYDPDVNDGATRGGLAVSILGDDGVRYYGSHFSAIDGPIKRGLRVTAGRSLGKVGRTGRAGACHLHLGISPPCARTGDWWVRRGVVYPWRYLDSWRAGGQASPVKAVGAWRSDNGCPAKAPAGA